LGYLFLRKNMNNNVLLLAPSDWKDYELLDSGDGLKFERFGKYKLVRPDPQALWTPHLAAKEWEQAEVFFERTKADEGKWVFRKPVDEQWLMRYQDLAFWVKFTAFKHTGVFPEQAANWQWLRQKIKAANRPVKVLNLFGYTGLAGLAAAAAGASVTHVDASKPALSWARDNQAASKLQDSPIRWLLDDVTKFVAREVRRGTKYDAIIMDPPVFGHGPGGEIWKFNASFPPLLQACVDILSAEPLFMLVNAYAISASSVMLGNVLAGALSRYRGTVSYGELVLEESSSKRLLSTGIFGRWEAN
jgi:23S rRNA (cytosine1962-C5)-methyltransferase